MRARNISIHVAYGSALPLNPSTTIHGRPIPPGYTSVTVEQIVGNNEDLELDFVGGDGEKTLGDALHGVVLWRKADIKLTTSTTAPMRLIARLRRHKGPRVLQLLLHQKRKEKDCIPPSGWTLKEEAENGRKKINLREDC